MTALPAPDASWHGLGPVLASGAALGFLAGFLGVSLAFGTFFWEYGLLSAAATVLLGALWFAWRGRRLGSRRRTGPLPWLLWLLEALAWGAAAVFVSAVLLVVVATPFGTGWDDGPVEVALFGAYAVYSFFVFPIVPLFSPPVIALWEWLVRRSRSGGPAR